MFSVGLNIIGSYSLRPPNQWNIFILYTLIVKVLLYYKKIIIFTE